MKLAIIGSGKIVEEALGVVSAMPAYELVAIWAREHSRARAEALADTYHIRAVYTDYAALLREVACDAVYIGLVNSAHYAYARQALEAGKNVIVEKPFAVTMAEYHELRRLAEENHLYLIEAVTPLHTPNFRAMLDVLPQLGQIRAVTANYSQYSSRYDRYVQHEVLPAFDPAFAGGALYDINIYNLNVIIGLFGGPRTVTYFPNYGWNGIDTSGVAVLRYDSFTATSLGAKDSESPCLLQVQGDKGWLRVNGAPNELRSFTYCLHGGEPQTVDKNPKGHRMISEFEDFARIWAEHDDAAIQHYLDISGYVMKTAYRARIGAGIYFPADQ